MPSNNVTKVASGRGRGIGPCPYVKLLTKVTNVIDTVGDLKLELKLESLADIRWRWGVGVCVREVLLLGPHFT